MKKLNKRSHWENEWADAFKDAEQKPSELVWQNIDSVLANKEAEKYKKRAVFYKWLAAASVFISACGAVLLLLSNPQDTSQKGLAGSDAPVQMIETPPSSRLEQERNISAGSEESLKQENGIAARAEDETTTLAKERDRGTVSGGTAIKSTESGSAYVTAEQKKTNQATTEPSEIGKGKEGTDRSIAIVADEQEDRDSFSATSVPVSGQENEAENNVGVQSFTSGLMFLDIEKKGLGEIKQEIAAVDIEVRKVWMPSDLLKNKKEGGIPRYWLGASVATNSFSPNFQDNSPNPLAMGMASNNFKPQQSSRRATAKIESWDDSQESVISLAGGLQGAAWLNEKWVVQAGLQYGTYKSSGSAGAYVDASGENAYPLHYSNYSPDKMYRVAAMADLTGIEAGDFSGAAVSAINTFEFLSVPLSIGYVVLDQKVGVLLSPGVSSEFFLSNQLTDKAEFLNDYSVKAGNAPYQTVHFRGLIGAQVFYKLGENYVVSIEPAYQHAITDFHKSGSYFNSRPSNISVGAGFRYIIR